MDENENIVIPNIMNEEEAVSENSLRPKNLQEYIGQNKVKESMKVYIEAAKREENHWIMCYYMALLD